MSHKQRECGLRQRKYSITTRCPVFQGADNATNCTSPWPTMAHPKKRLLERGGGIPGGRETGAKWADLCSFAQEETERERERCWKLFATRVRRCQVARGYVDPPPPPSSAAAAAVVAAVKPCDKESAAIKTASAAATAAKRDREGRERGPGFRRGRRRRTIDVSARFPVHCEGKRNVVPPTPPPPLPFPPYNAKKREIQMSSRMGDIHFDFFFIRKQSQIDQAGACGRCSDRAINLDLLMDGVSFVRGGEK